jgi:N-acetylglucosamine kinase-like BadF-type ATPase
VTPRLSAGADIGGTWLRLCVLAEGEKPLRFRAPLRPGERPALAIASALKSLGIARVDSLTVGARGFWRPSEKAALRRSLSRVCRRSRVLSDIELAHWAAFAGSAGVLLCAGTGSAAFARDGGGMSLREGGLGPLLGDEGSGFWIGRQWLRRGPERRALLMAKRPDAMRAVASLAVGVIRRARSNPEAAAIVREAASHLASLARRASLRLALREPVPLACFGGLFRSAAFRREFSRALGPGFALRPSPRSIEDAAALATGKILLR